MQKFQEVEFVNQDIPRNMNQLRMSRGRIGKSSASPGGTEKYYGTYIHTRFHIGLESMVLQTKNISSTTQQCRQFQEEEEIAPQSLEICAPIFFDMGAPMKNQVENGPSK